MKTVTVTYDLLIKLLTLPILCSVIFLTLFYRTYHLEVQKFNELVESLEISDFAHDQLELILQTLDHHHLFCNQHVQASPPDGFNVDTHLLNYLEIPHKNTFIREHISTLFLTYLNKHYDQVELLHIYLSLPHVGGFYTLQDLALEMFDHDLSDLTISKMALLLASASNHDPHLTFSDIHELRVSILNTWIAYKLISKEEYDMSLSWTPGNILSGFRSFDYYHIIKKAASAHEVDPILLLALVQAESAGNTRAVSKVGALGLAQLMPATAREIRPDLIIPHQLFKPEVNIDLGAEYLSTVLSWSREYFNDASEQEIIDYALAAYNAGWSRVVESNGIPQFTETRNYIKHVHWYYKHFTMLLNA